MLLTIVQKKCAGILCNSQWQYREKTRSGWGLRDSWLPGWGSDLSLGHEQNLIWVERKGKPGKGFWIEPPCILPPFPSNHLATLEGDPLAYTRLFCLALQETQQLTVHGAWALSSGSMGVSSCCISYQLCDLDLVT